MLQWLSHAIAETSMQYNNISASEIWRPQEIRVARWLASPAIAVLQYDLLQPLGVFRVMISFEPRAIPVAAGPVSHSA